MSTPKKFVPNKHNKPADADCNAVNGSGDAGSVLKPDEKPSPATEVGGRDGPDPTRYGDWEKAGRCIDF